MQNVKTTIVDCKLGDVTIPVTVITAVKTKYGVVPDYVSWEILDSGEFYEPNVVEDVYNTLKEGDVFVDIGANLGQYSAAARAKGATILAIEPQKEVLFEALKANVGDAGEIKWIGAGQAEGELEVHYAFMRHPKQNGLMANIGGNDLRGEGGRQASGVKVPVKKLDDVIGSLAPTIIKVDVERMEYDVMLGAIETLKKHHPILYLEQNEMDNFAKNYNLLSPLGYKIDTIFEASGTVVVKYV